MSHIKNVELAMSFMPTDWSRAKKIEIASNQVVAELNQTVDTLSAQSPSFKPLDQFQREKLDNAIDAISAILQWKSATLGAYAKQAAQ